MSSGVNFIDDPRKWRVSKSGFSIRTGWSTDKQIITQYSGPRSPMDNEAFRKWYEAAERICDLYNSTLPPKTASDLVGKRVMIAIGGFLYGQYGTVTRELPEVDGYIELQFDDGMTWAGKAVDVIDANERARGLKWADLIRNQGTQINNDGWDELEKVRLAAEQVYQSRDLLFTDPNALHRRVIKLGHYLKVAAGEIPPSDADDISVVKITTKDGAVFYNDSFGSDVMKHIMSRCDWVKIERLKMSVQEYQSVPATQEAASLLRDSGNIIEELFSEEDIRTALEHC